MSTIAFKILCIYLSLIYFQVAILCAALTAVSAVAYIPGHLHYAKAHLPYAAIAKAPLAYAAVAKAPLAYAPVVKPAPLAYAAPVHAHVAHAHAPLVAHAPLAYTGFLGHAHYGHGLYAPHYAKVGYGKVLW